MKKSSVLFALALMFLIIVLADLIRWFVITGETANFDQARQEYLAYYPAALQNARLLTAISLVLLTFSGFVFLSAAKTRSLKVAASLLGMLCALLLIWKIFSLM
jgi:hypothetical protein